MTISIFFILLVAYTCLILAITVAAFLLKEEGVFEKGYLYLLLGTSMAGFVFGILLAINLIGS